MAGNLKISQMDYKQLAADDQFPTVNASNVGENKYALGGDIPLLVGISQWNVDAAYSAGHVVIYNTTEVKGMFLVKSTTSPGDAPDNAAFVKFESLSLGFVNNEWTQGEAIGYQRTGTVSFIVSGSGVIDAVLLDSSIITDSYSKKITATVVVDDSLKKDVYLKAIVPTSGQILFYVCKQSAIGMSNVRIAYTIEG
jgi:hypothetical protein